MQIDGGGSCIQVIVIDLGPRGSLHMYGIFVKLFTCNKLRVRWLNPSDPELLWAVQVCNTPYVHRHVEYIAPVYRSSSLRNDKLHCTCVALSAQAISCAQVQFHPYCMTAQVWRAEASAYEQSIPGWQCFIPDSSATLIGIHEGRIIGDGPVQDGTAGKIGDLEGERVEGCTNVILYQEVSCQSAAAIGQAHTQDRKGLSSLYVKPGWW